MSRIRSRSLESHKLGPLTPQTGIFSQLTTCKKNNNDLWISASKTKNYLMDDGLVDWLELYYVDHGLNTISQNHNNIEQRRKNMENISEECQILFDKGIKFENKIMEKLEENYKDNLITINKIGVLGNTRDNYRKTIFCMKKGTPIIAQAVLFNDKNNTFGCADLIVRSDYLNKIFNHQVLTHAEEIYKAPKLKEFHYRVIDIKWMNLPLNSKADTMRKMGFIPAYKGQLLIYNCAIGEIQGFIPPKAYIMGKGWNRTCNKTCESSGNCFDKLGVIDYENKDNDSITDTAQALEWYRNVKMDGASWTPLDHPKTKNPNMFPNMCSDNMKWQKIKKEIANEIGEVTLICNVGKKEREILHSKHIYNLYDKRCTSENMGLSVEKSKEKEITVRTNNKEKMIHYPGNAEKIDNICDVNRKKLFSIMPKILQCNDERWQTEYPTDMYFDFETVNIDFVNTSIDIYDSFKSSGSMIFMIGVGYVENKKWNYKVFTMETLSIEEEVKCIDNFTNFVLKKTKELDPKSKYPKRLFHWSHAEITNINQVNERYDNRWRKWEKEINFVDMMRVLKIDGFAVKGAFDYSLKSIGNALYINKKIESSWPESDVANGRIAMFEAAKIYQNILKKKSNAKDKKMFEDIIKYNEIDCKIIWEIVVYLRNNHCGKK